MVRPLDGVRVISVEQYGAGPFATLHLADLGAEVIKIENPASAGDVGRYVPPFSDGDHSLFFETFNRNKRSVDLNLTTPGGREVFDRLVGVSDAVFSNLRGDLPEQMQLRYEDLSHLNRRIVCCSLSGFGMKGPRRSEPAYDYMLQGLAGWMSLTGEPDGPPTKSGLSMVDYAAGFVAAIALLAGILAARRDGVGMDCDLSLFDTAIGLLTYPATWHLTSGWEAQRYENSAHPSIVPFQNFETADGWIVVGCAKEKFWRRLVDAIGRPDLGDDPDYTGFAQRAAHRQPLLAELSEVFRSHRTQEWLTKLEAAGVPCAPVNSLAEALADPHVKARELIVETEHPVFGRVRQVASPVRVGTERPNYRRAPFRNEDLGYVLKELLALDDVEVERLRRSGVFESR
jgi:crotonobetainyl-CoA:carnitine CoA-transferase CaiB-like acyl-CoA transferase